MTYEPKNFGHLLGLKGFSDPLLKNHFTLYQGYVANTNKLAETLSALLQQGKTGPEFAELKRRFGWEFNGMRLHELYFGSMAKTPSKPERLFLEKTSECFGSFGEWERDFRAAGAMRGIGWVVLHYEPEAGRLFNTWINEHDAGHLSTAIPLLVMDVFEHAYMLDYGLNRAGYMESFLAAIDWNAVDARF